MNDIFDNLKKIEEQIKQVHAKFGAIKKLPSYTQEFQDSTKELLKVADKLSRRLDAFKLKNAVVDMDGTLADLYGVDKWIDDLDNKRARPYEVAKPMMNIPKINKALREMNVVVATWLSKVTDETFDKAVIVAKKGWLKKNNFKYNSFAPMSYGTNKGDAVKKRKLLTKGLSLLIDDDPRVRDSWQLGPKLDPTKFDVSQVVTDYIKTFVTLQSSIDSIKTHMRKQIKEMRVVPKRPKTTGTSLYVDDDDDDINKTYGFTSPLMRNDTLYNNNAGRTLSNDLTSNPDKLMDALIELLRVHDKIIPVVNKYKEALMNTTDPMEKLAADSFATWDEELNNSRNSIIKMMSVLRELTTTSNEATKARALDDAANLSRTAQRIVSRYGANDSYAFTSEDDVIEYTREAIDQLNDSLSKMKNSAKSVSNIFNRMLFYDSENMSAPSEYGKSTISSSIPPFEDAVKNTTIMSTAGAQLELVMYDLIRSIRESEIAGSEWHDTYKTICDILANMGPLTQVAAKRMFKMSNYVGDTNITPEDLSTPETKAEYIKLVAKAYMELYQRILALKHVIFTGATWRGLDISAINAQVDALKQNINDLVHEGVELGNWRYLTDDVKNYADSIVAVIPAVERLSNEIQAMSLNKKFNRKSSAYGNLKTYIDPFAWDDAIAKDSNVIRQDDSVQELIQQAKLRGGNIARGLSEGIYKYTPFVINASKNMSNAVLQTTDDTLDMHSPSEEMRKRGQLSAEGFTKGFLETASPQDIAQAFYALMDELRNVAKQGVPVEDKGREANYFERLSSSLNTISMSPDREELLISNSKLLVQLLDAAKVKYADIDVRNQEIYRTGYKYYQLLKDINNEASSIISEQKHQAKMDSVKETADIFMFDSTDDIVTQVRNLQTLMTVIRNLMSDQSKNSPMANTWSTLGTMFKQATVQLRIFKNNLNMKSNKNVDQVSAINEHIRELLRGIDEVQTPEGLANLGNSLLSLIGIIANVRAEVQGMDADTKDIFMQKIGNLQILLGSLVENAIAIDQNTIATKEAAKAQRDKDRETKKGTQSARTHTDTLKRGTKTARNYAYSIRKIWWGLRRTIQFMNRMRSKLTHLNRVFNSINKVGNLFKSAFASVTGFYIGSELKDVIKYSVDYVEILELFRVATSGARAEAEKFVDVMEDIYGLDPNTIMQTAGTFFQLTSAINMPIAAAQKMSLGLTKVGIDIASLFNQQYEDVIQDLTSGMQGMTRAVRKYGIDIRVSTLQTLAAKMGMDGLVSEMSEADRQGLRYIQILDNVRAASGNFAKTIESVANQFKIAKEQSIGMFRAIGNLFMPMLKKYMYQINAYLMTLKTVFTYIGTLVGFKPEYFDPETENTEKGTGAVDEYGNAIDKVKSKLNRLAGFDELEILQNNAADDEDPMNLELQKAIEEYEVMMESFTMKAEAMRIDLLKALGFTDSGDGTFDINFNFDTNEWDTTVQWLGDLGVTVQNIVTSMDGLGESFKGAFKKSWEAFKEFFQPITDIFKEMFGINSIHDVDEWFVNLKANLDNFSFDGFVQGLIDTVVGFGPKLLLAGIDMVFKILQGLVDGLNDNKNDKKLGEFVLDLGKNLGTHATDLVDGLLTLLSGMFEGMSEGLNNGTVKTNMQTFVSDLLKTICNEVPTIAGGALSLVTQLSLGMVQAVSNMDVINNIVKMVADLATEILEQVAVITSAGSTLLYHFISSFVHMDEKTLEGVNDSLTKLLGRILGYAVGTWINLMYAMPVTFVGILADVMFSTNKLATLKDIFKNYGKAFGLLGEGFVEEFTDTVSGLKDIIDITNDLDPRNTFVSVTVNEPPAASVVNPNAPSAPPSVTSNKPSAAPVGNLNKPSASPGTQPPGPVIPITPLTSDWEKYIQPIEVPSVSLGTNEVQSVVIVEDKTTTNNTPAKVELSAYDRNALEKIVDAIENGQATSILLDGRVLGQVVSGALKTELNRLGYTSYAW